MDAQLRPSDLSNDRVNEYEAKKAFLKLYHLKDIYHERTVNALLSWVLYSEDSNASNTQSLSTTELKGRERQKLNHNALANLIRIGETLKTELALSDHCDNSQNDKQCFRGFDAVSFIVAKGYTPSRESALFFGRELASKLSLFQHVEDCERLLLDEEDQLYLFNDTSKFEAMDALLLRDSAVRNLNLAQNLVIALCGHFSFESGMTNALQNAGLIKDQIISFPEGSMPLSKLSQFVPQSPDEALAMTEPASESKSPHSLSKTRLAGSTATFSGLELYKPKSRAVEATADSTVRNGAALDNTFEETSINDSNGEFQKKPAQDNPELATIYSGIGTDDGISNTVDIASIIPEAPSTILQQETSLDSLSKSN